MRPTAGVLTLMDDLPCRTGGGGDVICTFMEA
jgi:hypothetical protein